jgi:enoyl-CoA hydratase/carnithine racemase
MAATTGRLVDLRVRSGVAWLQLANPPLNCCTYEMMRDLDDAILQARFDDAVHVLVLRGAGEEVFCAGADPNMLNAVAPTFRDQFFLHAQETLDRLERTPKLVVAAVNGHAWGAGLSIALAADLRIALSNTALPEERRATLGLPEVTLGLMPGLGAPGRLTRLVAGARALELMVTGERVALGRALELGLVNHVWEGQGAEAFAARVQTFAESFGPPNGAAVAVGLIKRAVRSGIEGAQPAPALEHGLLGRLLETDDAREGLRAFLAGRPPRFTGK